MSQNDISSLLTQHLRDSKLYEARTVFLNEAVTPNSASRVVSELFALDFEAKKPIYLFVNSPGGEVNSGFSIYDTISFINSDVYVVTTGLCASIATIINIAVPKNRRIGFPNSKYLIHQPLISGQVQGPASDIEITANQILKTREKINKMLAEACGQPLETVEEQTMRDYWMDAGEALDYGLIGKIVTSRKDIKL